MRDQFHFNTCTLNLHFKIPNCSFNTKRLYLFLFYVGKCYQNTSLSGANIIITANIIILSVQLQLVSIVQEQNGIQ